MKYEISCDAVVFTRKNDGILYVIVKPQKLVMDFQKVM
jgi:hypothetical protein